MEQGPGALNPDEVITREGLGAALTRLRRSAGLSLRDVASTIDSSASTVGDWCRGDRLPFPANEPTFAQMLAAFGVENPAPWLEALRRVRDDVVTARPDSQDSPFPGLASFGPQDRQYFHGRDDVVADVVTALEPEPDGLRPPTVTLVGPSGSGKSSVIRAGVVPTLTERWSAASVTITPGDEPLMSLAEGISSLRPGVSTSTVERVVEETRSLSATLTQCAPASADEGSSTPDLVFVVDQLEEVLVGDVSEEVRNLFLDVVTDAATSDAAAAGHNHVVVLGLRVDFYSVATRHAGLAGLLQDRQVLLGPMTREQLAAAIREPARVAGASVEEDLVHLLLTDFVPSGTGGRHDPGALPLLGHALHETWKQARGGTMTVADYRRTGGVASAISATAEDVYQSLDSTSRAAARQLFMRLVQVDAHGPTTRRFGHHDELRSLVTDRPATDGGDDSARARWPEVVQRFVDARLLTTSQQGVEIAHEALLDAWPRLREWVLDAEDDLRVHRRLVDAARTWDREGRHEADLVHGPALEAMEQVAAGSDVLQLSPIEQAFLDASLHRREQRAQRELWRLRRLRMLVGALAVLTLVAGVLAVIARSAQREAVTARDNALSRQVAVTAASVRQTDPTLAAQMSLAGYQIADTLEARSSLLDAAIQPMATRLLGGPGQTSIAADGDGLMALGNSAEAVVQLFVGSQTRWRRAGRIQLEEGSEVYSMLLMPATDTLVVGLFDSSIRLWDVSDPESPRDLDVALHGPELAIQDLELAPSGVEVAASGLGDGVFRWDLSDPSVPRELPLVPSAGVTWDASYGPDGDWLAVAREDGTLETWRLGDVPERSTALPLGDTDVFSVDVGPDGQAVAAGMRTGELHLLEVNGDPGDLTMATPLPNATFESWVNAIDFAPDGGYIAAGGSSLQTRVWDLDHARMVQELASPAPVVEVDAMPDGSLLTASNDGGLYRWDEQVALPPSVPGRVFGVAHTPDGRTMATFSGADATVWNVADDASLTIHEQVLELPEGLAFAAGGDISADGRWLAITTLSGRVVVMDLQAHDRVPIVLGGDGGLVEQAKFSPDGAWLATSQRDPEQPDTKVWTMADVLAQGDEAEGVVIDDAERYVMRIAWSPDSRLLAMGSADDSTYLYTVDDASPQRAATLTSSQPDDVPGLSFSPDGSTLATGQPNGVITLWDVSQPDDVEQLADAYEDRGRRIYDLAFHPDGTMLASAGTDGTVGLLDVSDPDAPVPHGMMTAGDDPIYATAITPDGTHVVGAGADGWIRSWPMDPDVAARSVCADRGDPMTAEEWSAFVPDTPWNDPCA